jgi:hypothetical protein
MRESMFISTDQTHAEGRRFWGDYQEMGADVKIQRASANPVLLGVDRLSLTAGSQKQRVRVIGDNLPSDVTAEDIDFGAGVRCRESSRTTLASCCGS